jgi:serine/threonine-protein kinase
MAAPPPAAAPAGPPPSGDGLVGRKLNNRYLVEARIGEGGFGDVYKAKQIQMNREVAIKVLSAAMTQDPKLVERFRREAQSACNLRDPHTIITYDFDQTEDGLLYIAMELLQGEALFDVMEREDKGMSPSRVVGILEQCCTSLGEAHVQGIVHRDIKPENIFLENRPGHPDFVKILDFGIAKIVGGDLAQGPQLTAAGQTLGTLEYMSPEQLMGQTLDGRSDIYALGLLASQMLTGALPFKSSSPASIIQWHLKENIAPPSTLRPGIPAGLDAIVAKMLAKKREERYADVQQLRVDLQTVMAQQGWTAAGVSGPMAVIPPAALPTAAAPRPDSALPRTVALKQGQDAPSITTQTPRVSQVKEKKAGHGKKQGSPLKLIVIIAAVVVVALGAFLAYWFALRDQGGGGKSDAEDGKDGMEMSAPMETDMGAMSDSTPPPAKAPDPMAATAEAMAPAPTPAGGLLGVLGGGAPGAAGAAAGAGGGLGALLVDTAPLPAPGAITSGRQAAAGVKAAVASPTRVIPPEMSLVLVVNLDGLRRLRWVNDLLKLIPKDKLQAAFDKLGAKGLDPNAIGELALGMRFEELQGKKTEHPTMVLAASGRFDSGKVVRALEKESGMSRKDVSGWPVLSKDHLSLVAPDRRLLVMASDTVLNHALARLGRSDAKGIGEAEWTAQVLRDARLPATSHALLALRFPEALRKQMGPLLAQIKLGGAGDHVGGVVVHLAGEKQGMTITLALQCSSAALASGLTEFVPIILATLDGKAPAPVLALLKAAKLTSQGTTLALQLSLQKSQLLGLVALAGVK